MSCCVRTGSQLLCILLRQPALVCGTCGLSLWLNQQPLLQRDMLHTALPVLWSPQRRQPLVQRLRAGVFVQACIVLLPHMVDRHCSAVNTV
jgi:hypothetical protein